MCVFVNILIFHIKPGKLRGLEFCIPKALPRSRIQLTLSKTKMYVRGLYMSILKLLNAYTS